MKDVAFQELLSSIRQAGRIRRGKLKPTRVTTFRPTDVKGVREKLKASQAEFASDDRCQRRHPAQLETGTANAGWSSLSPPARRSM